jgi:hypothetical protein
MDPRGILREFDFRMRRAAAISGKIGGEAKSDLRPDAAISAQAKDFIFGDGADPGFEARFLPELLQMNQRFKNRLLYDVLRIGFTLQFRPGEAV